MYFQKKDFATVPSDLSLIKMDSDPFYRYNMEALKVWYDKKYTVLSNLIEVAKNLGVRPEYILQHFSIDLNTEYEKKEFKKRTQIRLIDFFEQQQLQSSLDKLIVDHLLCKICKLPELDYRTDMNRLKADCRTCGYFEIFDPRDDKMKEIIYNNPPVRNQKEIQEEEEDDLLYGNREFEYESFGSEHQLSEQENGEIASQKVLPYQQLQ